MNPQGVTYAAKSPAITALALCAVLTLATAALASPASENVPVPGGLLALARALDIAAPDPARCLSEIARLVHVDTASTRARQDSPYHRLLAHFAAVSGAASLPRQTEIVPVPLNASVWSHAVFGKAVSPQTLFAAILSDPNAALMAHGLAALDDETLTFFQNHPTLITTLYQRHATVFASFTAQLRIRDGRVVTPGGPSAIALWEAVLAQRTTDPVAFVASLYGRSNGRIAYLYDVIGHLTQERAAFALGLWLSDRTDRVERFRALARVATTTISEWDATRAPFSRPAFDLLALLQRVQVDASGRPRFPATQSLWAAALSDKGDTSASQSDRTRPIDAAWLAGIVLEGHGEARRSRLDQFAFGHRVFSSAIAAPDADVIAAMHGYPRAPMLMLTLERVGLTAPRIYAALAAHAARIAALDAPAKRTALAQFQAAILLIDRLVQVRSIDRATAITWLDSLASVSVEDRGYLGGLAEWLAGSLRPSLRPVDAPFEHALIQALAGPSSQAERTVSWEGQSYTFNLAAAESARLRRLRERPDVVSLDEAIRFQRLATRLAADGSTQRTIADALADARAAVSRLPETGDRAEMLDRPRSGKSSEIRVLLQAVDALAADALLSLAYAIHWPDPPGSPRLERELPRRHDFGLTSLSAEVRARRAWSAPRVAFAPGQPVRVEGALLGLEMALASLALRRTAAKPADREPRLLSTNRQSFVASLGLLDAFALRDADAASIADAIRRGQQRVAALTAGSDDVAAVIAQVTLDGWRARALRWNLTYAPDAVTDLFSLTELLHLGGGGDLDVRAWGMSALNAQACLCVYVPRPGLHTALVGRHQIGLLPVTIPDLNLRVAVVLDELQLPAALARKVLDAALYDLLATVSPAHLDDWLAVVRSARAVSREQIEDYLAGVTAAAGPLLPQQAGRRLP